MFQDILSIVMCLVLLVFIAYVVRHRKRKGIKGIKRVLSSIFLYLIAVTNLLAYWFNALGIVSWGITIVLLMAAAYFTKYIPLPNERT
ncbi:hypothetical protein WMZ97_10000 [Lentibacillus sp. N15]|uniref:hypothetical protein n=1 Tax=Lentibacillus songyuanensis TaxID=3136161 RepID=UPI0031BAB436